VGARQRRSEIAQRLRTLIRSMASKDRGIGVEHAPDERDGSRCHSMTPTPSPSTVIDSLAPGSATARKASVNTSHRPPRTVVISRLRTVESLPAAPAFDPVHGPSWVSTTVMSTWPRWDIGASSNSYQQVREAQWQPHTRRFAQRPRSRRREDTGGGLTGRRMTGSRFASRRR
jgi:hypothetical protein